MAADSNSDAASPVSGSENMFAMRLGSASLFVRTYLYRPEQRISGVVS
jgi:hypothetical protein